MRWTGGGEQVDFFLDTEFIDLDRAIELISLGLVAADGREFYAISTEFDDSGANDFVRSSVLPLLEPLDHPAWMSRAEMKEALVSFVGSVVPRFWAWGGAPYDWLAMAQLFPVEERVPDGWRTPRTTSRFWSSSPAYRSPGRRWRCPASSARTGCWSARRTSPAGSTSLWAPH